MCLLIILVARPGSVPFSRLWYAICDTFSIRVVLTENGSAVSLFEDTIRSKYVGGSVVKKCVTSLVDFLAADTNVSISASAALLFAFPMMLVILSPTRCVCAFRVADRSLRWYSVTLP